MAYTQKFREQHDDLLNKVELINAELMAEPMSAQSIVVILSDFLKHLKIHLAGEDKLLYPQLKNCGNFEVVAITIQYQTDMGEIANFVDNYSQKWQNTESILGDLTTFTSETKKLITMLSTRIKKENNYLYTLADDCLK